MGQHTRHGQSRTPEEYANVRREITVARATISDASAISSVLASNREDRGLFQESAEALHRTIEDFVVARLETEIVGCAGLHRDSLDLGEVYAVAVLPRYQGQGIGERLMRSCEVRARTAGIRELWLATIRPAYFSRYGFEVISRWELPGSVLLRKLRQTLQQPAQRWLPALFGRHTFMRLRLEFPAKSPGEPLRPPQELQ